MDGDSSPVFLTPRPGVHLPCPRVGLGKSIPQLLGLVLGQPGFKRKILTLEQNKALTAEKRNVIIHPDVGRKLWPRKATFDYLCALWMGALHAWAREQQQPEKGIREKPQHRHSCLLPSQAPCREKGKPGRQEVGIHHREDRHDLGCFISFTDISFAGKIFTFFSWPF